MRIMMVVAALAIAACSPAEPPAPAEPAATPAPAPAEPASPAPVADQASCTAKGGEWRPVCRMQQPACVMTFADAGRACKDGDDCAGDCMAPSAGGGFAPDGAAVTGACAVNDDPCGCKQTVVDGKATAAICID